MLPGYITLYLIVSSNLSMFMYYDARICYIYRSIIIEADIHQIIYIGIRLTIGLYIVDLHTRNDLKVYEHLISAVLKSSYLGSGPLDNSSPGPGPLRCLPFQMLPSTRFPPL